MRKEAAHAHRIANGESLLQEAKKALALATTRPDLVARIAYFLEHHKPMIREDAG
jgi:hypothetical protein